VKCHPLAWVAVTLDDLLEWRPKMEKLIPSTSATIPTCQVYFLFFFKKGERETERERESERGTETKNNF
jgi:hypothetical protein